MESSQEKSIAQTTKKNWHDKYYKILLIIPLILLVFSFIYILNFHSKNGDFFYKDISLTGGTSVTIYSQIDSLKIKQDLQDKLGEIHIREIYDLLTNEKKAIVIETISDGETTKEILEEYLGYELTDENSSFEFTGSSLSKSFYNQLLLSILLAFILMGITVFIIFRIFVPSVAVILSAFADILMTLVVVDIIGIKISSAGIVAFLMLIGYSVDTDILLTMRVLRRDDGTFNEKSLGALKTGLTMTLTALFSLLAALFVVKSFSNVLTQILTILSIGLVFDILNTWVTNLSILKWYFEKKKNV